jgi:hypothetical protein
MPHPARRLLAAILRLEGIDGLVVKKAPLRIETDHLTTGAKPGIDCKHRALSERRREEEFAQVGSKNGGRRLVRGGLQSPLRLGLEGRGEEATICIDCGLLELVGSLPPTTYIAGANRGERAFFLGKNMHGENSLVLAAKHGEHAVRRRTSGVLIPVEVVLVDVLPCRAG